MTASLIMIAPHHDCLPHQASQCVANIARCDAVIDAAKAKHGKTLKKLSEKMEKLAASREATSQARAADCALIAL